IVSVADKLDTIVGTISIGLIPTGSQDPYGLRRQAIGILRTMLEERWDIPFETFLAFTKQLFTTDKHETELINFFKDRAVYIFSKQSIENDVINAVLHEEIGILSYKFAKAKLLSTKRSDPSFKLTQESFVRVLNLSDQNENTDIDTKLFNTPSEKDLYTKFIEVKDEFNRFEAELEADKSLEQLMLLAEPIHDFFENNMVMDPNEALKTNRLALVNAIAALIKQFADLTLIEWRQHG